MNKNLLNILATLEESSEKPIWDNHMVHLFNSGHTIEVAQMNSVHPGRETAMAYLVGKTLGTIYDSTGTKILSALEELQVMDPNSKEHGAFRWYKEETKIRDTNASFFTMVPLVILLLFSPLCLSEKESAIIRRMLSASCIWFSNECTNPILFYTNKIVSDGAMLTAIGKLTNSIKTKNQSRLFLNKWLDYTESKGYGWGENLSLGYNSITLQAFAIIKKSLDDNTDDKVISNRFDALEEKVLDSYRFFNGYEFIPTIRSYNALGKDKLPSVVFNLAHIENYGILDGNKIFTESLSKNISNLAVSLLLYEDRLYTDTADYINKSFHNSLSTPRIKETHIVDDKYSYSWIGNSGGLGSLNKFPVIEGSYQHKTWGLGWQCFPVSAIVYENQVSFLRFNVDDGKKMRHHPHKIKNSTYLDPALFAENYYPDVITACHQNENTIIAVRSINKLRNKAKSISDSFDVTSFSGNLLEFNINDRQWVVLSYENANVILTPLMGITVGKTESSENKIEIEKTIDGTRLVQWLYNGSTDDLYDDRISTGWVIHYIDKAMTPEEISLYINELSVVETTYPDGFVPRMPQWNIHDIDVFYKKSILAKFKYDPYL